MRAYSTDLRERIVAAVEAGATRSEAAERFGVSVPTIARYVRLRRETGKLEPRPIPGRPARKGRDLAAGLRAQLDAHEDATLAGHCALWEGRHGTRVSTATMSRAIARLGWTRKKRR